VRDSVYAGDLRPYRERDGSENEKIRIQVRGRRPVHLEMNAALSAGANSREIDDELKLILENLLN
jgi:hypothetical protein